MRSCSADWASKDESSRRTCCCDSLEACRPAVKSLEAGSHSQESCVGFV